MTSQKRHIILFAILALCSFATWKYYFFQEEIQKDKPFTKGYSVEDIELKITNEKGELSAKFKSPSLIRYTDSPVLHINSPKFWSYSQGVEKWMFTSNEGKFDTEKNKVKLQGDLLAESLNTEMSTSFKAKDLTVDLTTKIAITSEGIALKQQQFSMNGQIAKFDLNNDTLEVNNNVKAIYKTVH